MVSTVPNDKMIAIRGKYHCCSADVLAPEQGPCSAIVTLWACIGARELVCVCMCTSKCRYRI